MIEKSNLVFFRNFWKLEKREKGREAQGSTFNVLNVLFSACIGWWVILKKKLGSYRHRMLALRKGLEIMVFIDGEFVARGVNPPFYAVGGHHRLITAYITAGPQSGLHTLQNNSSGSYYPLVRAGILVQICLPSVLSLNLLSLHRRGLRFKVT